MAQTPYVLSLDQVGLDDLALVGGKNASLGEMRRHLTRAGVRVPGGFAVTTAAYRRLLDESDTRSRLAEALAGLDPDDPVGLEARAAAARRVVRDAPLPEEVARAIEAGFDGLRATYGDGLRVAVRSSATAEDLPEASFAGQHASFLNVGGDDLSGAVRDCFASLFTARGIHYRHRHGLDQLGVELSVGVMKMVRADLASSGVVFTVDTESGHPGVVLVSAAWGLGENVVQGTVDPDEFYVHKATYRAGHRAVLSRRVGHKALRMVAAERGTRNVDTTPAERDRLCLDDSEVLELAGTAIAVEDHYGRAMDIEWAKDGEDGLLYVVQARPETASPRRAGSEVRRSVVTEHGELLARGRPVGDGVAIGRVRVVHGPEGIGSFRPGEVLVAPTTTPDWEPVLSVAAAVVTDRGGRTCHAAIVARELGLPAVVGAVNATARLRDGEEVTVSCAEGDEGHVYAGAAAYTTEVVDLSTLPRPVTKIMVNLGNPALALRTSMLPNDGVGLARMEFIISQAIKAHPLALLHPERVRDPAERAALETLVGPGGDGADYFVGRLSEGIGMIAAAFHPRPVIVRMSDFKTNEYADLLGGSWFEPDEANPMIGFRGASRYAHPAYAEGFALECRAVRAVREDMGLDNVVVMLPFVRRLAEADDVLALMSDLGLRRGQDGLEVYAMCEIPNNVVLVDDFAQRFDGLSIGSNDLTQLTLGVDRDSEVVAFDFDERDPGVKRMIQLAVEGCRRNGIHSGLCGQAPSDYPDMAEFLVDLGIDSMSLNPDSVLRTTATVVEAERRRAVVAAAPPPTEQRPLAGSSGRGGAA